MEEVGAANRGAGPVQQGELGVGPEAAEDLREPLELALDVHERLTADRLALDQALDAHGHRLEHMAVKPASQGRPERWRGAGAHLCVLLWVVVTGGVVTTATTGGGAGAGAEAGAAAAEAVVVGALRLVVGV